jgi:hypothetical protein
LFADYIRRNNCGSDDTGDKDDLFYDAVSASYMRLMKDK